MYIKQKAIEILSYDDELETIFAKGLTGSVVLDIIPSAMEHLRMAPKYKQIYVQDNMGIEFVIPQGASLEFAIESWQSAIRDSRALNTQNENLSPDNNVVVPNDKCKQQEK